MTHGGIELHGVEAERAVTRGDEDRFLWIGEARGDAVGHADTDTTEWSRVQHLRRAETDASEGEEVAAVSHDDAVIRQSILQRREHLVGM